MKITQTVELLLGITQTNASLVKKILIPDIHTSLENVKFLLAAGDVT